MVKPLIGEIVVLPFPQTDLQPGKRRPALVVADIAGDDLVLCQITSKAHHRSGSVSLVKSDFQQGNLSIDSFVRTNRLFTVDHSVIIYSAARISDAKLAEIRAKIRELFN